MTEDKQTRFMYQHELAHSGKHLFSIRGYYIYVVIALGIAVSYCIGDNGQLYKDGAFGLWFWFSLTVALFGEVIRLYSNGYAANGTSSRRKREAEAAELNTTGAYSLVRNPLYVGRIVNFTGLALLSGSWVYGVVVYLACVLIYERISIYEEEFLRSKFSDQHRKWASEVPALLPRFHGHVPAKYDLWFRRMVWREYKKFHQLGAAILLYTWAWSGFSFNIWTENTTLLVGLIVLCASRVAFKVAKKRGAFKGMR